MKPSMTKNTVMPTLHFQKHITKKTVISVLMVSLLQAPIASVHARVSMQNQVLEPQTLESQQREAERQADYAKFDTEADLAAESAQGESAQPQVGTLVGFSSGVIAGALVAGPVGAIVGAVAGTLIGQVVSDTGETEAEESAEQGVALKQSQSRETVASLPTSAHLSAFDDEQYRLLGELSLGMDVPFADDSAAVESHFLPQLDDVAALMRLSPELNLALTGYRPNQGDASYNQALSEQRLLDVRSYLTAKGIEVERMSTQVLGEASMDDDMGFRPVTLTLQPNTSLLFSPQSEVSEMSVPAQLDEHVTFAGQESAFIAQQLAD